MSANDIFSQLRDELRTECADDDALLAIASGETGTPRVLDLERRAGADPAVRSLLEASRPLGPAFESRVAASLVKECRPEQTGGLVVWLRRAAPVVGSLAVAASVLIWVSVGPRTRDGTLLPEYETSATSGQRMRGSSGTTELAPLVLHGGDGHAPFEILARPATAVGSRIAVYAFAMGNGAPSPVEASVEIAPEGSVRLRGHASALDGAREVRIVIGAADGPIRRFDDAVERARAGTSDSRVRVLAIRVTRD